MVRLRDPLFILDERKAQSSLVSNTLCSTSIHENSLVCNKKANPQLFCWKPGNFADRYTYLSPQALRRQLEGVICREGLHAVQRETLRSTHSTIFWNMVWYCSRLRLPLFIDGKHVAATSGTKAEILSPFDVLVCGNLSTFDGSVGIVNVAGKKNAKGAAKRENGDGEGQGDDSIRVAHPLARLSMPVRIPSGFRGEGSSSLSSTGSTNDAAGLELIASLIRKSMYSEAMKKFLQSRAKTANYGKESVFHKPMYGVLRQLAKRQDSGVLMPIKQRFKKFKVRPFSEGI